MAHSSDYSTVAEAIRFLQDEFKSQPTLEDGAGQVGASPFHFQRLSTRWAGVSPKRFVQFLTVEHAKDRLRAPEPVLRVAIESGLSGPARLHDLFVTTEAVTPGKFKTMGDQIRIGWGVQESPFGLILLGLTPRGICHLAFLDEADLDGTRALDEVRSRWPRAHFFEASEETGKMAQKIFPTPRQRRDPEPLSLFLKGTNFQIKVWTALLRVQPGRLTTYGRLADAIDHPRSARAVGSAVGSNAVAFLIPCRRVIREDGRMGEYRWGVERKKAILGWEAAGTPI
jgi:AraC family transcriptional regulator of adaptative response/methylated-DNA-[protein]-cysteine methyltransferase